ELLREMISDGLDAILVKVAAIGLEKKHLGMTLSEKTHNVYTIHDFPTLFRHLRVFQALN
ncbi:hypothetical protein ANCDUO_21302, partial [Ancylostoma duodenale]